MATNIEEKLTCQCSGIFRALQYLIVYRSVAPALKS